MINILLAAASKTERETIRALFLEIPMQVKVYEAQSEDEALQVARTVMLSLLVIDTELKDGSGLHCAAEIRKLPPYQLTWLIVISQYADAMLDAFRQLHCYEFLIKPYDANLLKKTGYLLLSKESTQIPNRPFRLFHNGHDNFKVYVDEIIFLEINARACTIHTAKRNYLLSRMPLKDVLRCINSPDVIQTHKSYAANIRHIRKIERYSLTSWNIYFDQYEEIALLGNKYKEKVLRLFENREQAE
ncbi:MAG: LytTR family DNA-binding domain-containing protein [Ethanoligenens sp.]